MIFLIKHSGTGAALGTTRFLSHGNYNVINKTLVKTIFRCTLLIKQGIYLNILFYNLFSFQVGKVYNVCNIIQ